MNTNMIETEQSVHLSEYYYILNKHKWTVAASLVVIVTLTALFTFLMSPVYQATATMVIDNENTASPLTGQRTDFDSYVSQSLTFNTHFKLITSRPVIEKVIKELNLDQPAKEAAIEDSPWKGILTHFKENLRLLLGKEEKFLSPEEKLSELTNRVAGKIDIQEVRDTRLLKVNVEDTDPVVARDIANALARVYIEFNISNRLQYSQNTLSWMTDQLYEVKKKLEDAEQEFLAYKQEEKLFSVEGKQKSIGQKIDDFNNAYVEARNKRLTTEAKLEQLRATLDNKKGEVSHARSLIENPLIDNLYSQVVALEVELSRLSKVYKEKHPQVVQAQTKLDDTTKKLREEINKEVKNLESERSVLLSKEKVLQKTVGDFETDALDTNKKELRYTILQRNVETNQKLYDLLLSKAKETNVTSNVDASNIRITENAVMPMYPVKPKKKMNLMLSVVFGLMTGVGLAFLWEYMDRTIRTEEDITRYLGLPVLSVIPVADSTKGRQKSY